MHVLKTFWFEETFNQKKNSKDNELGVYCIALEFFSMYILKETHVHYTQTKLYNIKIATWGMYTYKHITYLTPDFLFLILLSLPPRLLPFPAFSSTCFHGEIFSRKRETINMSKYGNTYSPIWTKLYSEYFTHQKNFT